MTVNAITSCAPRPVKPGPLRQDASWPAYLGTPRHDAGAPETLNADPRPMWHVSVGRAVRGSPAISEAVIAVGTADRNVVLVERESGDIFWRSRLDGTIRGGPLLDEDRLYVASEAEPDGRVYAVRLHDGKPLWRTRVGSVAAPLAYDGDALYAGTEEGTVLRLEPDKGRVTWRRTGLAGAVRSGPVPTPYGLAVATTADTLYLLDRETGDVRARMPTPGSVLATPASDGQALFFGTMSGRMVAVDLGTWSVRWDLPAGDAVYGATALVSDTVFAIARDGRLWIIPADAPDRASSHMLSIVATAGPTPIASGVLVGSVSGEVLLVDRVTGTIHWRAQVGGPIEEPPLVRDRQLVVVAGRGNIHTYR